MSSGLATDLYELTMAAGYHADGRGGEATFELYVRGLPPSRGYLIAAGLDQALAFLESLRVTPEEIAYLRALPNLLGAGRAFFDEYLPAFRFTGEVWAVAEGTPVFPPAPLLRVTAPLAEAQIVETALLAIVMFQTGVASKASRVLDAAAGRSVIEFGARRAHGLEAACLAARAAYAGGCEATSNTEAGFRFGIPLSGTMAHAWVTAFPREVDAFRRFAEIYGSRAVLLIDTYDTLAAARTIVAEGLRPAAVRLDSGDLAGLSREVRAIFDAGGLRDTRILASGELDEHKIAAMVAAGAPIDGFGVGAAISTAADVPSLGGVYKLVEVERNGRRVGVAKLSEGKQTWPCRKQVWRCSRDGRALHDLIAIDTEPAPPDAEPLLARVMASGRRVAPSPPLDSIRARGRRLVAALPPGVRRLHDPEPFPVRLSEALQAAGRDVAARAARR
jgi:nicotinate phosphoribosyltransferase